MPMNATDLTMTDNNRLFLILALYEKRAKIKGGGVVF